MKRETGGVKRDWLWKMPVYRLALFVGDLAGTMRSGGFGSGGWSAATSGTVGMGDEKDGTQAFSR